MPGSVFIAVPAFGQTNCTKTTSSLMALAKCLLASGRDYYFSTQSFPDIAELRNMLTTIFADRTEADHLLFVDADMGFEPQLVLDMLELNEPVVGCMYPVRSNPIRYVGDLLPGPPERRGGFMKVRDVGGGALLIRRDAVTGMLEAGAAQSDGRLEHHTAREMLAQLGIHRIIRAFDAIETESGKLSEDKSFCRRHRDCGGEIWAATDHTIHHVGPHAFSGRYADSFGERSARVRFTRPAHRIRELPAMSVVQNGACGGG